MCYVKTRREKGSIDPASFFTPDVSQAHREHIEETRAQGSGFGQGIVVQLAELSTPHHVSPIQSPEN